MNFIESVIILLSSILQLQCQECPAAYLRFTKEHSYCMPKNSSCMIFQSGVTKAQKQEILEVHNKYRSLVATGKEKRAGGMPEASDMLQLVWDEELAAVAQRRAEQCIFEHDCNNCRRVENFSVGQNIACKSKTSRRKSVKSVPNWSHFIMRFYEEVADFDKKYVKSLAHIPGKTVGHFTQLAWSKTWRIGCGYVAFLIPFGYTQLYVCNYGPSGNVIDMPMYETGKPCSECPINSCCGSSCKAPNYDGLCQLNNNNEAPIYRPTEKYIFYCDFRKSDGDCSTVVGGTNKWRLVNALGGPFTEIVLKGGESSTINFTNAIRPKQDFCLIVNYRFGPAVDGQKSSSKAVLNLDMPGEFSSTDNLPELPNKDFSDYRMALNWSFDTKVSFSFTVPKGSPEQFFDIQLVAAVVGTC